MNQLFRHYIWSDFHKRDNGGRLLLTTVGSRKDLLRLKDILADGLAVVFYDFDADDEGNNAIIVSNGTVYFDPALDAWIGELDGNGFRHEAYENAPAWSRVSNWHNLPGAMDGL